MNKQIEQAFNVQFQKEYESSYLYLAMANHFESEGFKGLASWMKKQSAEELGHAMRFYEFCHENNGQITLASIPAPTITWPSIKAVFEASLTHEQHITASINSLIDLAISEKAHAVHHFLLGFATEQVEEENNVRDILQKLELIGNHPTGLLMLDKELNSRA